MKTKKEAPMIAASKQISKSFRPSKLDAWFRAYIDESNPYTFMNKTGSAKAAGYKAKNDNTFAVIGHQNFIKLKVRIREWMDDLLEKLEFKDIIQFKPILMLISKNTILRKLSFYSY